jgi:putative chitinase
MITLDVLKKICPKTKESVLASYVDPLNNVGKYYSMFDDVRRIASFLAQVAHESGGFNFTKENLNYSADGLQKVFGKYFPDAATANSYARQPEKIANRVYANRMGNGNEASGDGYKFCGRGLIQLTGRDNYTKYAAAVKRELDDAVAYLETPAGAASSAGWFWDINKLNEFADKDNIIGMTKRINGGTNGLDDRLHLYNIALEALKG